MRKKVFTTVISGCGECGHYGKEAINCMHPSTEPCKEYPQGVYVTGVPGKQFPDWCPLPDYVHPHEL